MRPVQCNKMSFGCKIMVSKYFETAKKSYPMRRPGIEPGSQEWESWMMTITLTAPSGLGHSLAF